eukprot:RCo051678
MPQCNEERGSEDAAETSERLRRRTVDPFEAAAGTQFLEHGTQVQNLGRHSHWDTARCGNESRERKEGSACGCAAWRPVSGVRGAIRDNLAELQHRGGDRGTPSRVAQHRPRVQAATLVRRVVVQLDQDDELQGGYVLEERLSTRGQLAGSLGCTNLKCNDVVVGARGQHAADVSVWT